MPLPGDMDALIQGLLAEVDMAPDSTFCSRAFQADLDAFLRAQVFPGNLAQECTFASDGILFHLGKAISLRQKRPFDTLFLRTYHHKTGTLRQEGLAIPAG